MPDSVPRGLVFFARGKTARQRRARVLFACLLIVTSLALVWPGSPVFGLPFALAWVIAWLFIVLAAQAWLYRLDLRENE